MFRDYLRQKPTVRDEYGALKQTLLKDKANFEKRGMFRGYNLGKDALIRDVLNRVGFERVRILKCAHYKEWEAAKKLRAHYFAARSEGDPLCGTLGLDVPGHDAGHVHVVLCEGVNIVGYAHILWAENTPPQIVLMVIEDVLNQAELKVEFENMLRAWFESS
jgi:hypothetical protein